ncbi:hypothetical protein AB4230_18090, partial [Vibrio cyclitrophicus]
MFFALTYILIRGCIDLMNGSVNKITLSVTIIILVQCVNYVVSPFSNDFILGMAQTFIHIKAFLVLYLFSQFSESFTKRKVSLIFFFSFTVVSIGLVLNLIFGPPWHLLIGVVAKYRDGMIRPISIFENTANLGYFYALTSSVIYLTSNKFNLNGLSRYSVLFIKVIIDFILMHVITVRKLIIGVFPVIFIVFRKERVDNKFFLMISICAFVLVVLLLMRDSYIYEETLLNLSRFNTDDHYYIRGLMFYYGMNLFVEYFPFGTGGGTFGTIVSTINTLDVYSHVGLSLGWLVNESGKYVGIFDNGFGAYIGENGFIGVVSLIYFIFVMYSRLKRKNKDIAYFVMAFTVLTSFIGPAWQDGVYTAILSII